MKYSCGAIFLMLDGSYVTVVFNDVFIDDSLLSHKGNIMGSFLESRVMRGSIVETYYPQRHD